MNGEAMNCSQRESMGGDTRQVWGKWDLEKNNIELRHDKAERRGVELIYTVHGDLWNKFSLCLIKNEKGQDLIVDFICWGGSRLEQFRLSSIWFWVNKKKRKEKWS